MMLLQLMVRGPEYFIGRESPVGLEARLDEDPLYARHMRAIWLRAGFGGTEPTHNHMRLYRDPVPQPPWLGFASPTLLIHGIEDRVVPHERIIEQTASFENRSVKLMPRVGHRLVHLAMGEVLRTVRSEWDNVRSTGPPR
jgi:pimeloyl-ACP methyl ester carboxylesterase